jgi:hypothetical protein
VPRPLSMVRLLTGPLVVRMYALFIASSPVVSF